MLTSIIANIGALVAYITLAIDWVNPYKFVSLCGDYVHLGLLEPESRMLRNAAGRGSHFAGSVTPVLAADRLNETAYRNFGCVENQSPTTGSRSWPRFQVW